MDEIFQTTFSNAFSSMKMYEFWLRVHVSLYLRVQLTLIHHWLRLWLGADQATSHYLNQWWSNLLMHICVTQPQWVKFKSHKMSFAHILCLTCQILLKFCTWYGSIVGVHCAKFQKDLTTEMDWMNEHEYWREILHCNRHSLPPTPPAEYIYHIYEEHLHEDVLIKTCFLSFVRWNHHTG